MSSRDQQDECPKAFYCLPESCGDCPMDQQDEQATRLDRIVNRADEYAITAFNRRRNALRGTSLSGFPEDNEKSDLLREGFHYGQDHGRAEGVAMGVRVADELINELATALHRAGADLQELARGKSKRPSLDAEVAAGRCVTALWRVDAIRKQTP